MCSSREVDMHRVKSVVRPIPPGRAIVGLFAALVSIVLLPSGVALADTVTTDFENFSTCNKPMPVYPVFPNCGSVNGQDFWKSSPPAPNGIGDNSLPNGYDQQVVLNAQVPGSPAPSSFGTQSLRLSNALNPSPAVYPPVFYTQTYSRPNTQPDGEDLTDTVFTGRFSFISMFPGREQPGLHISVSPDDGTGGRMSYIALDDASGPNIHLLFYDTNSAGKFVPHDLGTVSRDQPHTIQFWMRLVPGPDNDLVRIAIDGQDSGQCYTTWENYYRAPAPVGEHREPPVTNSFLFLSSASDAADNATPPTGNDLSLLNGGYLFDNVTTTTTAATGPPSCDLTIDKTADSPTVTAGGVAGYQITVHNRGRLAARHLLLCDRIPRRTTFVSASRRLSRLRVGRCLLIPRLGPGQSAGFHVDLRVASDAPPGSLSNIADVLPGVPGGAGGPPVLPPLTNLPLPILPASIRAVIAQAPPIARARALVRILRARSSAPTPPPVTG
jgi:uncharacterized repeat protein (TIGR01451 family)